MKGQRASRTAHLVAQGRAMAHAGLSHVAGFTDPAARVLLTEKGQKSLAKTEEAFHAGKQGMRMQMARVMADMMALRTTAIDAAVRSAITDGARQLVILGAGFDGRAWRMPELSGVKVFEVDHPSTQRDKRERVAQLPPAHGEVHFVTVDFTRDSLGDELARAGHEQSTPTCWIWEGVTMYLKHDAMMATLRSIAARSAKESTLIVNYHTPHRAFISRLIFRLIGEPQISAWTPAGMAADLASAGFVVRDDSGMLDWNARFAGGTANVQRGYYMRVAIAVKE
jgi:methyltransferase (TIGR00027 family)